MSLIADTVLPLLSFVVPGTPKGAERHRVGKGHRMYHTREHQDAQDRICALAMLAARKAGLEEQDAPLRLRIDAWFARPVRLRLRRHRDGRPLPYTGKPDADNIAKLVMDALSQAHVWSDDTRVSALMVERWYTPIDSAGEDLRPERVEVQLWPL